MEIEKNFQEYLNGKLLYGDDFSDEKIISWFNDQKENYCKEHEFSYSYHALNYFYGYKFLPYITFEHVLSFGGATGEELLPILDRIKHAIVLEPNRKFWTGLISPKIKYIYPDPLGNLNFDNDYFDLITCFGVLHHIPNCTKILLEFHRCLKKNGYILLREPIISLDLKPHKKLKKRNFPTHRGIPLNIFRKILIKTNFKIIRESKCWSPVATLPIDVIKKLFNIKTSTFNMPISVFLDKMMCFFLGFNTKYYRPNLVYKFGPTSVFYILTK
ncbi:MAG: class I SAM-dependent methyltransferase [Endomicrobiia bacterium]